MTSAPPAPPSARRDPSAHRERSPWPYRRRLWFAFAIALAVHAALHFLSGTSLVTDVEFGMEEATPSVDVELVEQAVPQPEPPAPPPTPPPPPPPPEPPKPEPVPEPPKPDDFAMPKPAPKPVAPPPPPKPRATPRPAEAPSRPRAATPATSATTGTPGAAAAGRTTGPGHLYNPKPAYPAESREAGEHGTVVLRVRVETDGRPGGVTLARSSGHPRLDRAALEAVRRWRFKPATRDGLPFATTVEVPVRFSLR